MTQLPPLLFSMIELAIEMGRSPTVGAAGASHLSPAPFVPDRRVHEPGCATRESRVPQFVEHEQRVGEERGRRACRIAPDRAA